jgi:aldose 1-epimerase
LTGGPTIAGTDVTLHTDQHLPVTDDAIPLGTIEQYPGINAGEKFTLGPEEPNVDHCFIKNTDPKSVPLDTRTTAPTPNATFYHPESKVHLEILSTEPAFQFYTGKFIDVPEVDGIPARQKRSGFCIEPSRYVDAASRDDWRGMVLLKKGQLWGAKNVYKAWRD